MNSSSSTPPTTITGDESTSFTQLSSLTQQQDGSSSAVSKEVVQAEATKASNSTFTSSSGSKKAVPAAKAAKTYNGKKIVDAVDYSNKSECWQYYYTYDPKLYPKEAGNVAICKSCLKCLNVKKSRRGLISHLQVHENKNDEFKKVVQQHKEKKRNQLINGLNAVKKPNNKNNDQTEKYFQSVVAFVVEANLPFSIVEHKGFRQMIDTVDSFKVSKPLTRVHIRNEVESLGCMAKESIKAELNEKYFAITTDHWTSNANDNYSCLTAHWLDEENEDAEELEHAVLSFVVHDGQTTGEQIGQKFIEDFEKYNLNLDYVVAVVTDTTANMNTFGTYIMSKSVCHLYCIDYLLHLVALKAFDDSNLPGASNVMKRCREICHHFSKSTQASKKLKEQQLINYPTNVPKTILQYVATRWWSTYRMIEIILYLHPFITGLSSMGSIDIEPLTNDQVSVLKEMKQMLEPMDKCQKMLEGQKYVTISLIPMSIFKIEQTFCTTASNELLSDATRNLSRVMHDDLIQKRFGNTAERMFHNPVVIGARNRYTSLNPLHLAATALDPRMKNLSPFISSEEEKEEIWAHVLSSLITHTRKHNKDIAFTLASNLESNSVQLDDDNDDGFFAEINKSNADTMINVLAGNDEVSTISDNLEFVCANEIEFYRKLQAPDAIKTKPIAWWNQKSIRVKLPHLRSLAFKLLCVPATSAPSERLWSLAARILVKSRARLKPEIVEDLLFLKENGRITKKHLTTDRILPTVYEAVTDDEERKVIQELIDEMKQLESEL
eukprot:CAMPEP_0184865878 /NCGR_PEP_ID=MMETSP0580-20130426/19513_1 /TAXON_ID=1118495 /ORGANISM="Dactyliosolen fragilissimus" /LENGTH=777 /DNA_ID=CAMNT_0027365255 /DNA_START=221 /DNA_END=2554 /DNA_ORIENTATION=-